MDFLNRFSNYKTLALFTALYLYVAIFIISAIAKIGPNAEPPLDLLFTYSPDHAYDLIERYEDIGRNDYAFQSLTSDTLYPVVYTILFMIILTMLIRFIWPARAKLRGLALIPLFAFVFDLCENFFIRKLLNAYPERLDTISEYASLFTSLKWCSVGVTFAVIILFLTLSVIKKIKESRP